MDVTRYQIVLFNNKSKKRIVATSRIFTNINKKYKLKYTSRFKVINLNKIDVSKLVNISL